MKPWLSSTMRPPSGSGERHARREGLGRDRSTLGCRSAAWLPVFQSSFRSPGKCAEDEEDGDDGEESVRISTINVTSTAMPVQDSTSLDRMRIAERIVKTDHFRRRAPSANVGQYRAPSGTVCGV